MALRNLGLPAATSLLVEVGKGVLFVTVSAAFILWLVRRELREITRASNLLNGVVDGTTDAVFVKDEAGRYLLFNEAASRLVGKPVEEAIGRDDHALFEPESARMIRERDLAVMRGGVAETREERLTASGVTRTYHGGRPGSGAAMRWPDRGLQHNREGFAIHAAIPRLSRRGGGGEPGHPRARPARA